MRPSSWRARRCTASAICSWGAGWPREELVGAPRPCPLRQRPPRRAVPDRRRRTRNTKNPDVVASSGGRREAFEAVATSCPSSSTSTTNSSGLTSEVSGTRYYYTKPAPKQIHPGIGFALASVARSPSPSTRRSSGSSSDVDNSFLLDAAYQVPHGVGVHAHVRAAPPLRCTLNPSRDRAPVSRPVWGPVRTALGAPGDGPNVSLSAHLRDNLDFREHRWSASSSDADPDRRTGVARRAVGNAVHLDAEPLRHQPQPASGAATTARSVRSSGAASQPPLHAPRTSPMTAHRSWAAGHRPRCRSPPLARQRGKRSRSAR